MQMWRRPLRAFPQGNICGFWTQVEKNSGLTAPNSVFGLHQRGFE